MCISWVKKATVLRNNGGELIAGLANGMSSEQHADKGQTPYWLRAEKRASPIQWYQNLSEHKSSKVKTPLCTCCHSTKCSSLTPLFTSQSNFLPAPDLDAIAEHQKGCYSPAQMGLPQTHWCLPVLSGLVQRGFAVAVLRSHRASGGHR